MLSQNSLKTVLERIDHAVVLADTSGSFVMWNKAAEKILGLPETKKNVELWKDHFKIFKIDGTMYSHNELPIIRAAVLGQVVEKEKLYLTGGGEKGRHLEVEAFPLEDLDGRRIGGAASFKDITEHVNMEKLIDDLLVTFNKMKSLLGNNFFS